jgi:hypothetical protein
LSAQHRAVTKLLLILILVGSLANAFAASESEPPLLIDSSPSAPPVALDVGN